MEAVLRSQTDSFHNMENHIELIEKRIVEEPLSHIPSNMVTLGDVEEQLITFPMFMDDNYEIAQELEEYTSQGFQELLPNTSEVEESKKDECTPENIIEFEEREPEKENEKITKSPEDHKKGRQETEINDIEKSERVNPLTLETNFVLENNKERKPLMEFKGDFENFKREQSSWYEKVRESFSPTLTLIDLLFSFKKLKFFVQYLLSWIQELKTLIQDFDL
ncbi:hypothetical protein M9H77_18421 [Catharanthus roseus]|uniref:Uncharacterized protein n=1 Tax=Catharanthus roseus TaxID=4058 RepID=A0ACC0B7F3_CATRO|nr:hypothetical protein M9H77_18421 [Catharanthus roseus]